MGLPSLLPDTERQRLFDRREEDQLGLLDVLASRTVEHRHVGSKVDGR